MSTLASRPGLTALFALALIAPARSQGPLHQLTGHTGGVRGVAFAPGGKVVATIGDDRTIRTWDAVAGKPLGSWRGHAGPLRFIAFAPDGKTLFTGSSDRTLRHWDVQTGRELRVFAGDFTSVSGMALSPNAKTVAACGYLARSVKGRPQVRETSVWVWETATGKLLARSLLSATSTTASLAFSPDGATLAAGCSHGTIRLLNPRNGRELRQLTAGKATVTQVAFSPDGRLLASAGSDRLIRLYERLTGKQRLAVPGIATGVPALAFAPDSRTLATTDRSTVRLLDVLSGKELKSLSGHTSTVHDAAFSADGKVLASAGADRVLRLWPVAQWSQRTPPAGSKLTAQQLQGLWEDLDDEDAARAYRAMATLYASARSAVEWLGGRLEPIRPLAPADRRKVPDLLGELEAEHYATRQKAREALIALGPGAAPEVKLALTEADDVDLKLRLHLVLSGMRGDVLTPTRLRNLRALEVLERLGTDDARRLLRGLAEGVPEARLTREARSCLTRLTRAAGHGREEP